MISRCSFLIDMPFVDERSARGTPADPDSVGRSPANPKLLGVSTMPVPKCCFQMRLTITRIAIGCAKNRLGQFHASAALRERRRRTVAQHRRGSRAATSSPRLNGLPRDVHLQIRRCLDVGDAMRVREMRAASPCAVASMSSRSAVDVAARARRSAAVRGPSRERPAARA